MRERGLMWWCAISFTRLFFVVLVLFFIFFTGVNDKSAYIKAARFLLLNSVGSQRSSRRLKSVLVSILDVAIF